MDPKGLLKESDMFYNQYKTAIEGHLRIVPYYRYMSRLYILFNELKKEVDITPDQNIMRAYTNIEIIIRDLSKQPINNKGRR